MENRTTRELIDELRRNGLDMMASAAEAQGWTEREIRALGEQLDQFRKLIEQWSDTNTEAALTPIETETQDKINEPSVEVMVPERARQESVELIESLDGSSKVDEELQKDLEQAATQYSGRKGTRKQRKDMIEVNEKLIVMEVLGRDDITGADSEHWHFDRSIISSSKAPKSSKRVASIIREMLGNFYDIYDEENRSSNVKDGSSIVVWWPLHHDFVAIRIFEHSTANNLTIEFVDTDGSFFKSLHSRYEDFECPYERDAVDFASDGAEEPELQHVIAKSLRYNPDLEYELPGYGESEYNSDEVKELEGDLDVEQDGDAHRDPPGEINSSLTRQVQTSVSEKSDLPMLGVESVTSIIEQEIMRFEERWRSRQLPKLLPRAHRIWAKLRPFKEDMTIELSELNSRRIEPMKRKIVESGLKCDNSVRALCAALEPSIEMRCETQWKIDLMSGPQPERVFKPDVGDIRQSKAQKSRKPQDDDSMSDFIDDDNLDEFYSDVEENSESTVDTIEEFVVDPLDHMDVDEHHIDSAVLDSGSPKMEVRESKGVDQKKPGLPKTHHSPGPSTTSSTKENNETAGEKQTSIPKGKDPLIIQPLPSKSSSPVAEEGLDGARFDRYEYDECTLGLIRFAILKDFPLASYQYAEQLECALLPFKCYERIYKRLRDVEVDDEKLSNFREIKQAFFTFCLENDMPSTGKEGKSSFVDYVLTLERGSFQEFEFLMNTGKLSNSEVRKFCDAWAPTDPKSPVMASKQANDIIVTRRDDDESCAAVDVDKPESSKTQKKKAKKKRMRDGEDSAEEIDARTVKKSLKAHERSAVREHEKFENLNAQQHRADATAEKILVNIGRKDGEREVYLDSCFSGLLKPHQIDGVRFLWKNVCSLVEGKESGCILAHSMGLGKTLQTIAFVYTLAKSAREYPKTVPKSLRKRLKILVVSPLTVVSNWINEFRKWIPFKLQRETLGTVTKLLTGDSIEVVNEWYSNGGVLVTNYDCFLKMAREDPERFVSPGADLVVLDESHKIKNPRTDITTWMHSIRTKSRICLTGSPLQNNLKEYWAMVEFVRPGYLSSEANFTTRFTVPIESGLGADCSESDRRYAARRLYILQTLLNPLVNRLNVADDDDVGDATASSVVSGYLTVPKYEFTIKVRLTKHQAELYEKFLYSRGIWKESDPMEDGESLNSISRPSAVGRDVMAMSPTMTRVVNHPYIAYRFLVDVQLKRQKQELSANVIKCASPPPVVKVPTPPPVKATSISSPTKERKPIQAGTLDDPISLSSESESELEILEAAKPDIGQFAPQVLGSAVTVSPTIAPAKPPADYLDQIQAYCRSIPDLESFIHSNKTKIVKTILEETRKSKEKALLFTHSIPSLDYLESKLSLMGFKTTRLDGQVPANERHRRIEDFNKLDFDVFLISTLAGSLGMNCQSANRVILFDVHWNPTNDEQAIARSFRYGQHKPVYVYRLYSYRTMEDTIYKLNMQKLALFKSVIDKKSMATWYSRDELKRYFDDPTSLKEDDYPVVSATYEWPDAIMNTIRDKHIKDVADLVDHGEMVRAFRQSLSKEDLEFAKKDLKEEYERINGAKPEVVEVAVPVPQAGQPAGNSPNMLPDFKTLLSKLPVDPKKISILFNGSSGSNSSSLD